MRSHSRLRELTSNACLQGPTMAQLRGHHWLLMTTSSTRLTQVEVGWVSNPVGSSLFQVVKVSSTSLVRPIQVESVQISLIDSIRSCLVQPGSPSRSNGQFDLAFRSPHGPCWVKCNLNGCSYRDLDREIRDLNRYPKI